MLQFEWDENKNTINKKKHGISFEEAETAFYDDEAVLYPAASYSPSARSRPLPAASV